VRQKTAAFSAKVQKSAAVFISSMDMKENNGVQCLNPAVFSGITVLSQWGYYNSVFL